MNTKTKRRMIAVTGVIVIVVIILLAVVGGNSAAKTVTVAEAVQPDMQNKKIEVTGNVVENSFTFDDDGLTFSIFDPDGDPSTQLTVRYEGGVSATFGNDVTAICTGRVNSDGVLECSELVTKCPSKYENATDALSISQLLGYDDSIIDKPVKVTGTVLDGTVASVDSDVRFVIVDADTNEELSVIYDGALSDDVKGGATVVLTGSLTSDRAFSATDVALG